MGHDDSRGPHSPLKPSSDNGSGRAPNSLARVWIQAVCVSGSPSTRILKEYLPTPKSYGTDTRKSALDLKRFEFESRGGPVTSRNNYRRAFHCTSLSGNVREHPR
jgi:hypothetical protein